MGRLQAWIMDSSEPSDTQLVKEQPVRFSPYFVLAEARFDMARLLLEEIRKEETWITDFCSNFQQLTRVLSQKQPNFLLFSSLEDLNWLEACRRCLKQWHQVKIILLVEQPKISQAFRDWVVEQGIREVISSHSRNIANLRVTLADRLQNLDQQIVINPQELAVHDEMNPNRSMTTMGASVPIVTQQITTSKPSAKPSTSCLTIAEAIVALNQISAYCMGFFGPLAIGNYWQKAYHREIEHHLCLQDWTVDHNGNISGPSCQSVVLTAEQLHSLQAWVKALIKECQRIIIDFPELLHRQLWSPQVLQLISTNHHVR